MKKLLFLTFLAFTFCENAPVSDTQEVAIISGASYGDRNSRVQFRNGGSRMKVSYQVGGFDVVTGPTYEYQRQDGANLIYSGNGVTATVSAISRNSVTVQANNVNAGNAVTFTPRGSNLGARP